MKTALVTGASRGIGAAIAKTLAKDGYYVVVNYSGSQDKAQAVVDEIIKEGGEAQSARFNVSDEEKVKEHIKAIIKNRGSIDVLVNNAGITRDNLLMKMSKEEFDEVIDINLKGAFYTMQAVSRQMLKQRSGVVINISSYTGMHGNAGQMNYAASKAGVIGMTKTMARELASRNIRVNAIAPGFVSTDMTQALGEEVEKEASKIIPLGRFANPQEIADVASFLASDKAAYITGQVIAVDGGMSI